MTTATVETPAPAQTADPSQPSLSDVLYGPPAKSEAAPPEPPVSPEPTADSAPSPTPEESATAPAETKAEDPPKGTEDDTLKKQLAAQRKANGELGRKVADYETQIQQLSQEMKVLKAKLDGTYEEPPAPTEEQIRAQAEFQVKEKLSRAEAAKLFGEETVQAQVYAPDSPYQQLIQADPAVHVRVMRSDLPVVQAMRELKRHAFETEYGSDPEQWEAKIADKLKPKFFTEFKKQLAQTPVGQTVPTVSEARAQAREATPRERSLAELLYGGHADASRKG